jgi:hypothetical protein
VGIAAAGSVAVTDFTVGLIFNLDTTATQILFQVGTNNSLGPTIYIGPTVHMYGVSVDVDSGITISAGTPYFVAMSSSSTLSQTFFVVVNLSTGKIQTASTSTLVNFGNCDQLYLIGNRQAAQLQCTGGIAAVMSTRKFNSLSTLMQWATDPWSFWYPRNIDLTQSQIGAAAAAFKAYWANQNNILVISPGSIVR